MKPIVLMPTVARRSESFVRRCMELARQTFKPTHVVVIFDKDYEGGSPTEAFDDWLGDVLDGPSALADAGVGVIFALTHPDRAQMYRWTLVDTIRSDRVVFTLDDDLIINPRYVRASVDALRKAEKYYPRPVISWGGIDFAFKWRRYEEPHAPCGLVRPQAGTMCFRAGRFHGITATPFARKGHVRGGSEEIPLAWWADRAGIQLIRPSSESGSLLAPAACAFDAHACHRRHVKNWTRLLEWAEDRMGWRYAKPLRWMYEGRRPTALTDGGLAWTGVPRVEEVFS